MAHKAKYILHTRAGYFALAEDGGVLYDSARRYHGTGTDWKVIGIGKRHHSNTLIGLDCAAAGIDIGQGWVHDIDHDTRRMWAHPSNRRAYKVVLASPDYQIPVTDFGHFTGGTQTTEQLKAGRK